MICSAILAIGQSGQIGLKNSIPWKLKDDMFFFKKTTLNHIIVFGRKTFETINKPLINRTNIILSRNLDYKKEGCTTINNITDIIKIFQNEQEIFICGGAEIYEYFFKRNIINKIYLTKVNYNGDCDKFLNLDHIKNWTYKKIKNIYKSNINEYDAQIFIGEKQF